MTNSTPFIEFTLKLYFYGIFLCALAISLQYFYDKKIEQIFEEGKLNKNHYIWFANCAGPQQLFLIFLMFAPIINIIAAPIFILIGFMIFIFILKLAKPMVVAEESYENKDENEVKIVQRMQKIFNEL